MEVDLQGYLGARMKISADKPIVYPRNFPNVSKISPLSPRFPLYRPSTEHKCLISTDIDLNRKERRGRRRKDDKTQP
ncbi:hypothetical protein GBA52_028811 [Prunus armeniaca]|nr:hypothetical protein GBA52_028811 [Prunus armeniaca]